MSTDSKLKVKAFDDETFTEGYEEFIDQNKPILLEYASIRFWITGVTFSSQSPSPSSPRQMGPGLSPSSSYSFPATGRYEMKWYTSSSSLAARARSSTKGSGRAKLLCARRMGSDILSVRQARALGPMGVAGRIPAGVPLYVTIDIDAFCPSIAPGTGTPIHGGFLYYDVLEMLQEVARSHEIIGIDLVEVAPDYDQTGSTAILAAQILLNFLGFIFHARGH